jgi:hypothetical protein
MDSVLVASRTEAIVVFLNDGSEEGSCHKCAKTYDSAKYDEFTLKNQCSGAECTYRSSLTFAGKKYCNKCNPDEDNTRAKWTFDEFEKERGKGSKECKALSNFI